MADSSWLYKEIIRASKEALGQDVNDHTGDEDIEKVLWAFDHLFGNGNIFSNIGEDNGPYNSNGSL